MFRLVCRNMTKYNKNWANRRRTLTWQTTKLFLGPLSTSERSKRHTFVKSTLFISLPELFKIDFAETRRKKDSAIKLYWHYAITDVPHERRPRERIERTDRLNSNQLTAYILLENSTTDFKFEARLLDDMKSTIWPWVGFKPAWILPNFLEGQEKTTF